MRLKHIFFTMLITMSFIPQRFAQGVTTRVYGVVTDQTGGVVPGATIKLIDNATGREVTKITDERGEFVFTDVLAGQYKVIGELAGFKTVVVSDVKVDVGIPTRVNMKLEVGEVAEVVDVSAASAQPLIQMESAELQTVVLEQQIKALPINGRNPIQLASLQAGINVVSGPGLLGGGFRSAFVHGLRGSFTNLTWDGININDNFVRTDSFFALIPPNVDAVSEFSISTSNIGADSGLGVGQTRLTTQRGASEYHGSAYWFHRNAALDANSFFNNATPDRERPGRSLPKEQLIRNQFGGNIGGPVLKDKLFFFTDYQGSRTIQGTSVNRSVLTAPARQGFFTYRGARDGQLHTINLLTLSGRAIDPRMRSLIDVTPLPNNLFLGDRLNTAGFRFNAKEDPKDDQFGVRLDYNYSTNHRFEGVYRLFRFDLPNQIAGGASPGLGQPFPGRPGTGQNRDDHLASFAWNWTAGPSLTNELRGGFHRMDGPFTIQERFADGLRLRFPPGITNPVQNFLPQGRSSNNYDLLENMSWINGKHVLRFGGNFRRVTTSSFNDADIIPIYNLGFNATRNRNPLPAANSPAFPGGISSNDFTRATHTLAALIGSIGSQVGTGFTEDASQRFNVTSRTSGFVQGAGEVRSIDYWTLGIYFNDTFRIKPNLTLNYGLRWEFISPPTETKGLALLPLGDPIEALIDPETVVDFYGSGTGRPFFKKDLHNFAPNFSIAWDPFGTNKTSIRAGFAISYAIDSNITSVRNAFIANPGLAQTRRLVNEISGTVSGGGIRSIAPPAFRVPRRAEDNLIDDPTAALYAIDKNLRTPYVQQWTFGIQREVFKDSVVEFRYVGNHALKMNRALDFNQVDIRSVFDVCQDPDCNVVRETSFLQDFVRARNNFLRNRNPNIGEPLLLLRQFDNWTQFSTNPIVTTRLLNNEAGDLMGLILANRATFFGPNTQRIALTPDFFLNNPSAYVADYLTALSGSTYHGFETEFRRRWRGGLTFQANYTWSKVLTDFDGGQTDFSPYLDNDSGRSLEKKRADNDINHYFKANWVYELPIGPGRRFLNSGGPVGKFLEGWNVNGIWLWRSGLPISIVSGRGTVNRTARSFKNTVNTTVRGSELRDKAGNFRDAQGQPNIFDPSLIGPDGRARTDLFADPGAGQLGTLGLTPINGPGFFNVDISIFKRTRLTERTSLEFRTEFLNAFNNVNFSVGGVGEDTSIRSQNINSETFGRINSVFAPRVLQMSLRLNF